MILTRRTLRTLSLCLFGLIILSLISPAFRSITGDGAARAAPLRQETNDPLAPADTVARRVNVPYFSESFRAYEAAVFWFGRVNASENYADVRVGYTSSALIVRVNIMDRLLWYDGSPSAADLTNYDAVSLYISRDGSSGNAIDAHEYRFVAMDSASPTYTSAQAAYTGAGSGWNAAAIPFTATSTWRGDARNNMIDDRGWTQEFTIRFADLGLGGAPAEGTIWGLAVQVHDRDAAGGSPNPAQFWPETLNTTQPATWGQLHFGLPSYTPPAVPRQGAVTIRQGLNGAQVTDAAVGGTVGRLCPGDPDYVWNHWGDANFAGDPRFNLQNQADIADWPCFSKYYVTFPTGSVPSGSAVLSATFTLHQFGGSDPSQAQRSLIQVFTVAEAWSEATLTWNNAPLALENVSRAWAGVVNGCSWPCEPRDFDVSQAAANALAAGQPLRLAVYEADTAYHSGKHFIASEEPDWNAVARPTLTIVYGDQIGSLRKTAAPITPRQGESVSFRVAFTASGDALTLNDQLPAGLSAPIGLSASTGSIQYSADTRTLTWTGTPDAGQQVVITYSAVVQTSAAEYLVGTATLQGGTQTSTARATVIANGFAVMLPMARK